MMRFFTMSESLTKLVAVALMMSWGALASASAALAEEKKKDTIESKISEDAVETCLSACRINFQKELGVSLEYLGSIGQQIHDARIQPDPVGLALAGRSLEVAEKLSGKTASVSASSVMGEAVKLAKLRDVSEELTALALIVPDSATKSELEKLAIQAKAREKESREKIDSGEEDKAVLGTLRVVNHSHECVRAYMDGRYLGLVHEGQSRYFHVHSHNWHNHFDAYCSQGGEMINHSNYAGHTHYLTWHIHH